jgi:hypothetical protein
MRRLAVLALLAVLAAAVAARRRSSRTAQLAEPPAASGGLAPAAAPPAPGERFVSVEWTLADPPGAGSELVIRCHQDDQLVLDRVDVQETPTQVFLTAIARREPRTPGEPRREHAHATVALSGPLGERELIATPVDPYP